MKRLLMVASITGLMALLLAPAGVSAQQVTNVSIPCQSYYSEFMVSARSDTIWARLNTTSTLSQIMGMDFRAGLRKMVDVGDAASMWSERDTGKVILSFVTRRTEMHFVFEPDSGTYFNEDQWKLYPIGTSQTRVTLLRRRTLYTPQPTTEIADQSKYFSDMIARLIAIAEGGQ